MIWSPHLSIWCTQQYPDAKGPKYVKKSLKLMEILTIWLYLYVHSTKILQFWANSESRMYLNLQFEIWPFCYFFNNSHFYYINFPTYQEKFLFRYIGFTHIHKSFQDSEQSRQDLGTFHASLKVVRVGYHNFLMDRKKFSSFKKFVSFIFFAWLKIDFMH